MSTVPGAAAASADGRLVVCGDGPEVLAYRGAELVPAWRHPTRALVADLAVDDRHVWVLDVEGGLEVRSRSDGTRERGISLPPPGRFLAMSGDGATLAVAAGRGLTWMRDGELAAEVDLPGLAAVGIDGGGTKMAAGLASGTVVVFDLDRDEAVARIELDAPVSGVVWSPAGYWLVACGSSLIAVRADGAQQKPLVAWSEALTNVVLGPSGAICVAQSSSRAVTAWDLTGPSEAGTLAVGRDIDALLLLPPARLLLGLRHGDLQAVDLLTGRGVQSVPHPGRRRVPWSIRDDLTHGQLRGARVRLLAGGGPLAEHVVHAPPGFFQQPGGRRLVRVLQVTLGLAVVCGGGGLVRRVLGVL